MKVYIDEKPENCDVCPCQSECWCNLTNQNIGYMNTKGKIPEDCPLELIAQHDKEKDQRIAELEEENKNLNLCRCCECKSENEYMLQNTIRDLEEENAELKEQMKNAIMPKYKIGQKVYVFFEGKFVLAPIEEISIYIEPENDLPKIQIDYRIMCPGYFFEFWKESEVFTTNAEMQKYLEAQRANNK